MIKLFKKVP
jgi:hypothetical protein